MANTALIVEDEPLFQRRLANALTYLDGGWKSVTIATAERALEEIKLSPEPFRLALIDILLPGKSGLQFLRDLQEASPSTVPLVVSVVASEQSVLQAIRLGAQGYICKQEKVEDITKAIAEVLMGLNPISPSLARHIFRVVGDQKPSNLTDSVPNLSSRNLEVLSLLAAGLSYAEAAKELGISLNTFQTHIRTIYKKLGVRSSGHAIAKVKDQGWL